MRKQTSLGPTLSYLLRLLQANAMVKSDLDGDLAKPSTAIGMIVAALRQRRDKGTPSFTVLSCDNLPENGDKVREKKNKNVSPAAEVRVRVRLCFLKKMVVRWHGYKKKKTPYHSGGGKNILFLEN